jgi:hypothetical protein
MSANIKDQTGWIPFVLFTIFAVAVAVGIAKGSKKAYDN